jgi:hypothetical protein
MTIGERGKPSAAIKSHADDNDNDSHEYNREVDDNHNHQEDAKFQFELLACCMTTSWAFGNGTPTITTHRPSLSLKLIPSLHRVRLERFNARSFVF